MPTTLDLPECLRDFQVVTLNVGSPVFQAGDPCTTFFFLLKGSVRVDLITDQGKSVLLYHIGPNETCILTASCLISDDSYCAEALTETEVEAVAIPKAKFQEMLNTSQPFRELVFRSFSSRLSAMMVKIDEVSFASLDKRLARRLLELRTEGELIEITHEQLANDLGSAREVISRKLVDWEKQGLITRARGSVRINDANRLNGLSGFGD